MQLSLIEARRAGHGMSDEQYPINISYLAELYEEMEDCSAALKARQEVYEVRKGLDLNIPKTLHQASRIAILYEDLLDWKRVVEFRRKEAQAWHKIEGSDSKKALLALMELAFGLEKVGRYTEAIPIIDDVIQG